MINTHPQQPGGGVPGHTINRESCCQKLIYPYGYDRSRSHTLYDVAWEVEGIIEDARKRPGAGGIVLRMTWKVLGLSQKDAQFRNKWRKRIKGATG